MKCIFLSIKKGKKRLSFIYSTRSRVFKGQGTLWLALHSCAVRWHHWFCQDWLLHRRIRIRHPSENTLDFPTVGPVFELVPITGTRNAVAMWTNGRNNKKKVDSWHLETCGWGISESSSIKLNTSHQYALHWYAVSSHTQSQPEGKLALAFTVSCVSQADQSVRSQIWLQAKHSTTSNSDNNKCWIYPSIYCGPYYCSPPVLIS